MIVSSIVFQFLGFHLFTGIITCLHLAYIVHYIHTSIYINMRTLHYCESVTELKELLKVLKRKLFYFHISQPFLSLPIWP